MASQPRCAVLNPRAVFEDSIPYAEPRVTSFRLVNTGGRPRRGTSSPPCPRARPSRRRGCASRPPRAPSARRGDARDRRRRSQGEGARPAALAGAAGLARGVGRRRASSSRRERFERRMDGVFRARGPDRGARRARATAGSIAEAAWRTRARSGAASRVSKQAGGVSMVSPAVVSMTRRRSPAPAARSAPDLLEAPFAAAACPWRARLHARRERRRGGADLTGAPLGSGRRRGLGGSMQPRIPVDAILVLHLDRGRDFFLTVAGTVRASVFGKPLWRLPTASVPAGRPAADRRAGGFLFSA